MRILTSRQLPIGIAMLLVSAAAAIHADPVASPTTPALASASGGNVVQAVPGVTVTRKTDPLSRSDRHLARLKKSLPGSSADTPQEDGVDRTKDYLAAHSEPNSAAGEQRQMMKEAEDAPPEGFHNDGAPTLR